MAAYRGACQGAKMQKKSLHRQALSCRPLYPDIVNQSWQTTVLDVICPQIQISIWSKRTLMKDYLAVMYFTFAEKCSEETQPSEQWDGAAACLETE